MVHTFYIHVHACIYILPGSSLVAAMQALPQLRTLVCSPVGQVLAQCPYRPATVARHWLLTTYEFIRLSARTTLLLGVNFD